jgi:hypothetical protein
VTVRRNGGVDVGQRVEKCPASVIMRPFPLPADRAKTMRGVHHSRRRKASILSLQALEKLESTYSQPPVPKLVEWTVVGSWKHVRKRHG